MHRWHFSDFPAFPVFPTATLVVGPLTDPQPIVA
jgi:hypothetical protein